MFLSHKGSFKIACFNYFVLKICTGECFIYLYFVLSTFCTLKNMSIIIIFISFIVPCEYNTSKP